MDRRLGIRGHPPALDEDTRHTNPDCAGRSFRWACCIAVTWVAISGDRLQRVAGRSVAQRTQAHPSGESNGASGGIDRRDELFESVRCQHPPRAGPAFDRDVPRRNPPRRTCEWQETHGPQPHERYGRGQDQLHSHLDCHECPRSPPRPQQCLSGLGVTHGSAHQSIREPTHATPTYHSRPRVCSPQHRAASSRFLNRDSHGQLPPHAIVAIEAMTWGRGPCGLS